VAAGACVALIAAACGGGGGGDSSSGGGSSSSGNGDTGAQFGKPDDEGKPQRGGKIVYGLEAETGGGWCLPGAQLAAGGIEVAVSIYDTLTAPARAADGSVEYVPFLAESVEPNATYDQWTIKVRPNITFHNGEPLNAAAVKQNLDAYRGQAPSSGPLFSFVFEQINDVVVVDDSTVQVNMDGPWVGFDAFIWGTGRVGMVAPAQLNDADTCNRNLIGTGPFRMTNCSSNVQCGWTINDKLVAEANPDYWRTDADGEKLPYIDEIEFRPVIDAQQRLNGLIGGELNLMHTTDGPTITEL
jgi:peptide/nickel transport system substrate-binding protein